MVPSDCVLAPIWHACAQNCPSDVIRGGGGLPPCFRDLSALLGNNGMAMLKSYFAIRFLCCWGSHSNYNDISLPPWHFAPLLQVHLHISHVGCASKNSTGSQKSRNSSVSLFLGASKRRMMYIHSLTPTCLFLSSARVACNFALSSTSHLIAFLGCHFSPLQSWGKNSDKLISWIQLLSKNAII